MNLAKRNLLALAENSKQVLLLKANWNDEGGKAVSAISFCRAMELAFHIINTTKQNLCPEINVCPDGNIDLAFREKQFFLLVKVSPDSISWYGDDGEEKNQIQGKQRKIHSRKMIDWILSSVEDEK